MLKDVLKLFNSELSTKQKGIEKLHGVLEEERQKREKGNLYRRPEHTVRLSVFLLLFI